VFNDKHPGGDLVPMTDGMWIGRCELFVPLWPVRHCRSCGETPREASAASTWGRRGIGRTAPTRAMAFTPWRRSVHGGARARGGEVGVQAVAELGGAGNVAGPRRGPVVEALPGSGGWASCRSREGDVRRLTEGQDGGVMLIISRWLPRWRWPCSTAGATTAPLPSLASLKGVDKPLATNYQGQEYRPFAHLLTY